MQLLRDPVWLLSSATNLPSHHRKTSTRQRPLCLHGKKYSIESELALCKVAPPNLCWKYPTCEGRNSAKKAHWNQFGVKATHPRNTSHLSIQTFCQPMNPVIPLCKNRGVFFTWILPTKNCSNRSQGTEASNCQGPHRPMIRVCASPCKGRGELE